MNNNLDSGLDMESDQRGDLRRKHLLTLLAAVFSAYSGKLSATVLNLTKKAGKNGLNNRIYQSFYDDTFQKT